MHVLPTHPRNRLVQRQEGDGFGGRGRSHHLLHFARVDPLLGHFTVNKSLFLWVVWGCSGYVMTWGCSEYMLSILWLRLSGVPWVIKITCKSRIANNSRTSGSVIRMNLRLIVSNNFVNDTFGQEVICSRIKSGCFFTHLVNLSRRKSTRDWASLDIFLSLGLNSEFITHMANSSKLMLPLRSESKILKTASLVAGGKMTPSLIKV